jgi:bifunctional non-homologous end joining protein LigD
MASMSSSGQFDVAGRRLTIRNLDRVVFPRAGTTKADILGYYMRVADTILAHLRGRPLHMHRYPEGVEGPRFWQKACPEHRPTWVQTVPVWSRDKRSDIEFCVIDELATLVWAVNIGSLELHTSLHTRDALHRPTVLAFDLDPGDGVDCSRAVRSPCGCARCSRGSGCTGSSRRPGPRACRSTSR